MKHFEDRVAVVTGGGSGIGRATCLALAVRGCDVAVADMEWMTDINVWGVVHGCRAFLPLLREADEAHIVNVSSMAGLLGFPQNVIYS